MSKENLAYIRKELGETSRAIKLQEELAELSVETAKLLNTKNFDLNAFVEEYCDVMDLADEILLPYGIAKTTLNRFREAKQNRTIEYIKSNSVTERKYLV